MKQYVILFFTGLIPKNEAIKKFESVANENHSTALSVNFCHRHDKSDRVYNGLLKRPRGVPIKELKVYVVFDPTCSASVKAEREKEAKKKLLGYDFSFICNKGEAAYLPARVRDYGSYENLIRSGIAA